MGDSVQTHNSTIEQGQMPIWIQFSIENMDKNHENRRNGQEY